jgi:hypothetical protein
VLCSRASCVPGETPPVPSDSNRRRRQGLLYKNQTFPLGCCSGFGGERGLNCDC